MFSVRSLLKSPFVLGGTGLVSAGGLGVGSWQIYEESNPTVNRKLLKQGYSYSPVQSPDENRPAEGTGQKFLWNNWDCTNRLFKGVEIKNGDIDSSTPQEDSSQTTSDSSSVKNVGSFITCAIMDLRPITPTDAKISQTYKNSVYFKSEVVVKGENYGGIMGNGLSSFPKKESSGSGESSWDLTYRLLELKKDKGNGVVNRGGGWEQTQTTVSINDKFIIAPPIDQEGGFTEEHPRYYKNTSDFEKKVWAGIGEVDDGATKDLLSSISIYAYTYSKSDEVEFGGSNGEFNLNSGGYKYSGYFYHKDKGWMLSKTKPDISSALKGLYEPFKDKKIKGTNLKDKCDYLSRERSNNVKVDDIRSICYYKG